MARANIEVNYLIDLAKGRRVVSIFTTTARPGALEPTPLRWMRWVVELPPAP
jgi:hypothetical protein